MEREVLKADICWNGSAIIVFTKQQVKKRGFTSTVPSSKTQFAIGINLKANVFEDVVVATVISKSQVGHID